MTLVNSLRDLIPAIPLIQDVIAQRRPLARVGVKLLALLALLYVADRSLDRFLRRGLEKYFGLDRPVAVACIGQSRTVLGIDAKLLEQELQLPVAKYAVQGANGSDRHAMLQHLIQRHAKMPAVIVLDVSAYTFNDDGLSSNSYQLFFPFLDEPAVSRHLASACGNHAELRLRRLVASTRYNEATIALAMRGHLGVHQNLKWNKLNTDLLERRIAAGQTLSMSIREGGVKQLRESIELALENGVAVLLAYIPTVDILNNLDRQQHDEVIALIDAIAANYDDVWFVDFNRDLETRHELFADGLHVNGDGQRLVTEQLAVKVKETLDRDEVIAVGKGRWRKTGNRKQETGIRKQESGRVCTGHPERGFMSPFMASSKRAKNEG